MAARSMLYHGVVGERAVARLAEGREGQGREVHNPPGHDDPRDLTQRRVKSTREHDSRHGYGGFKIQSGRPSHGR